MVAMVADERSRALVKVSDVEQCGHSGTKPHSRQSTKRRTAPVEQQDGLSPRSYTPCSASTSALGEHGRDRP